MKNSGEKVFVVEDEASIRKFININLKREGFHVYEFSCGEDAIAQIASIVPDVIVLDVMLHGMDGFEICSRIRENYPDILIIILTVKNQDMDKIMGLELGADDYMVKPFNPLELMARINAMLRRAKHYIDKPSQTIASGIFIIDLDSQQFYINNQSVDLTPREFSLMKVFMENPNRALSRDELLNEVWGQDFYGDYKTVDVHVSRLREKIDDNNKDSKYIQTIWGFGYRFKEVK